MKQSVKSSNPCLSGRQACISVIQTFYDIVKAYGGELKVETKESEGSTFVILIPVS